MNFRIFADGEHVAEAVDVPFAAWIAKALSSVGYSKVEVYGDGDEVVYEVTR